MYHSIVARKVAATFRRLSSGDAEALTAQLAPLFTYRFVGDHALGGTRSSIEEMQQWSERLYRLFPDLRFDVEEIAVNGPPWNTRVLTRIAVRAEGYDNEMFQHIELSWGRITSVTTLEDVDTLRARLEHLARLGHEEASAPPIGASAALSARKASG